MSEAHGAWEEASPALKGWLGEHLPRPMRQGAERALLRRCAGGYSNLTYVLKLDAYEVILRRAPPGTKAATAHDMGREARMLEAVRDSFPWAPEVLGICLNEEVLGTHFFVMTQIRGLIPGRRFPVSLTPGQRARLMDSVMSLHAKLHAVDVSCGPLSGVGHPEGYVGRQVQGWSRRYRHARTHDVPTAEALMRWLDERQPKSGAVALIHNDFKLDNIVLSPDDPSRILGVLDWEMSTIGDPMVDLGCSMAYWVESSDPAPLLQTRTLPSTEPGMPSRRQLLRMYEAHTGRPLGDFRWYRVFGLFRLAVIAQQIYLRYTLGQTRDPRFAGLGAAVGALVGQAEVALQEYAG